MLRALILSLLLLPLGALAQQETRIGGLTVYHNTFNSSYLQPEIAAGAGLVRGPRHGVVTLAVHRDGKPVDALLQGQVTNLLSQTTALQFIRIEEGEAVYFVANYTAAQRGLLRFEVKIRADANAPEQVVRFQQEFHPDE